MLSKEQTHAIEPAKKVMLIIFSALILGLVAFTAVASMVRFGKEESLYNMDFGFIAIIGVGFAALVFLPSIIVPTITQRAAVKEVAEEFTGKLESAQAATKMFVGLQTSMIIGLALLEGAAFFNVMAFLIDGSVYSLIAVAALLFFMIVRIPLPDRIGNKIANMLDDAKHA